MRIALVHCSAEEIDAVSSRLTGDCSVVDSAPVTSPEFDIAVIGSAAVVGGTLSAEVRARVGTPAVVILPSADLYAMLDPHLEAVTMDGMDRLPFAVRRELHAGAAFEITLRRRTEDALAEREAQLSFAHELARLGSWELDLATNRVTASPELAVLFGLDESDTTGDAWLALIVAEDVPAVEEAFRAAAENGSPFDVRFRIRNGVATLFMHAHARWIGGEHGERRRLIGVTQDVTTEMIAQRALRESEARYRSLVEQAKDIIVSLDRDGRVRSLNKAFEEVTGWSRIEWIGRLFSEALDTRSAAFADGQFTALLRDIEFAEASEFVLRRRDGTTITVEAWGRAVESAGEMVEVVVVARDVTERKEREARVEKEKRLASLGQLATSVAHEFNNVLMSIMPFAELLQRRLPGDERVSTATSHIIGAVRRGREISREILRFARPAAPEVEAITASDWVAGFRQKAQAILGPLFQVSADFPAREIAFSGDPSLLDQVATNLTLNARDAMPEGGPLHIAVRTEGNAVAIDFVDGGGGIAPELLDRIFEPLYTTKRAGNGLGLTVAHQAMLQQSGSIRVRSAPGEGSTFTLVLPQATLPPLADASPPVASVRRVLIVEDDESVGEGLRVLLADEGFEVHLVERGLEATAAVEAFRPGLVLLDVNLPDVNGVEVYDAIHRRWPDLPVIFSTGHADARALADVDERRVPSIMKPYDIEELLAVIATVTV